MNRKLNNKVFISTRPQKKNTELRILLKEHGAHCISMPMISIKPTILSEKEKEIIINIQEFDYIVFTSQNGVELFLDFYKRLCNTTKLPSKLKIAAIGNKTAEKLNKHNISADFISKKITATEFLLELIETKILNNKRVLLPFGKLAKDIFEKGLQKTAMVTRINVYQTEMPDSINEEAVNIIKEDKYDMILFTSPSGFDNFSNIAKKKMIALENIRIISIGKTTNETINSYNCTPLVTSNKPEIQYVVEALLSYYNTH